MWYHWIMASGKQRYLTFLTEFYDDRYPPGKWIYTERWIRQYGYENEYLSFLNLITELVVVADDPELVAASFNSALDDLSSTL